MNKLFVSLFRPFTDARFVSGVIGFYLLLASDLPAAARRLLARKSACFIEHQCTIMGPLYSWLQGFNEAEPGKDISAPQRGRGAALLCRGGAGEQTAKRKGQHRPADAMIG